ncbi:hypothetical protein [Mesonia aestuariivivens]|uniref:Uncharacterized protein n=1 Tax=Mesonia aestuariivivens TaxID=2796128 RepID=A0ABS6W468_9FLAO|nr:hypothetical protein [Mesonia aestuariivivens]MBW2961918.1 hypothetical protein [Mesonia aestuariivivens]
MKYVILTLFILIVLGIATGFYVRIFEEDLKTGDIIIGISVLTSCFIMMPLFIYHRWNGKKLEDYTLSPKNIKKMKDRGLY